MEYTKDIDSVHFEGDTKLENIKFQVVDNPSAKDHEGYDPFLMRIINTDTKEIPTEIGTHPSLNGAITGYYENRVKASDNPITGDGHYQSSHDRTQRIYKEDEISTEVDSFNFIDDPEEIKEAEGKLNELLEERDNLINPKELELSSETEISQSLTVPNESVYADIFFAEAVKDNSVLLDDAKVEKNYEVYSSSITESKDSFISNYKESHKDIVDLMSNDKDFSKRMENLNSTNFVASDFSIPQRLILEEINHGRFKDDLDTEQKISILNSDFTPSQMLSISKAYVEGKSNEDIESLKSVFSQSPEAEQASEVVTKAEQKYDEKYYVTAEAEQEDEAEKLAKEQQVLNEEKIDTVSPNSEFQDEDNLEKSSDINTIAPVLTEAEQKAQDDKMKVMLLDPYKMSRDRIGIDFNTSSQIILSKTHMQYFPKEEKSNYDEVKEVFKVAMKKYNTKSFNISGNKDFLLHADKLKEELGLVLTYPKFNILADLRKEVDKKEKTLGEKAKENFKESKKVLKNVTTKLFTKDVPLDEKKEAIEKHIEDLKKEYPQVFNDAGISNEFKQNIQVKNLEEIVKDEEKLKKFELPSKSDDVDKQFDSYNEKILENNHISGSKGLDDFKDYLKDETDSLNADNKALLNDLEKLNETEKANIDNFIKEQSLTKNYDGIKVPLAKEIAKEQEQVNSNQERNEESER